MSKLRTLLDEYRRLRALRVPRLPAMLDQALAIADYLLTLDASDLDLRDRINPACPRIDAARRAHPMDEVDFE